MKYFDGEKMDYQDFRCETRTMPMFNERKLIILTNIFDNQEFKEKFLKNSRECVKSENVFIFYEQKLIKKNDALFKFLKKEAKSQEFQSLSGYKLKNWIKKEAQKYNCEIEPSALEKLINLLGNDLWRISEEIKKLVSYVHSVRDAGVSIGTKKKEIGLREINLLIKPEIENDIFKTIDAIASKNKSRALALLHQHTEEGESPLYLLSMINFQFRNVLEVKNLLKKNYSYWEVRKKSALHPFVIQKSCKQAENFSEEELGKIYQKLFEADLNIKTGRLNPETALDLLIAEI